MTYAWESHTSEAQLYVSAASEEQVFEEAVDAFARLVERDAGGEPASHTVRVEAADRGGLLVALMEELIFLADTEGFIVDRAVVSLEDGGLRARLEGRRTVVDPLVKAATYHDLGFERRGQEWHARIVLDV